jgi:hypothetical protein
MLSAYRKALFGRHAGRQLPFSTRLSRLEEVPPVFNKTVARLLEGREAGIRHIIYTPEFGTFGEHCPATLFVVNEHEWMALAAEKSGAPTVRYADFAQTRLLEFLLALLQGRMVIEAGETGEDPCVLRFNLTSWDLFRTALHEILEQGLPSLGIKPGYRELPPEYEDLSFGMRSTLQESILPGDNFRALVSWTRADTLHAPHRLAMHPGGIVLTDRFLCIVTADDPSERNGPQDLSTYDRGVTYLDRRFPIVGGIMKLDEFSELQLTVGAENQSSSIHVGIPNTRLDEVKAILDTLGAAN